VTTTMAIVTSPAITHQRERETARCAPGTIHAHYPGTFSVRRAAHARRTASRCSRPESE
jgi:hypothetical protein